jgi:hypothetical protein
MREKNTSWTSAAKNQQQNTTTNQKYAGATKEGKEMRRFDGGGTAGEAPIHGILTAAAARNYLLRMVDTC